MTLSGLSARAVVAGCLLLAVTPVSPLTAAPLHATAPRAADTSVAAAQERDDRAILTFAPQDDGRVEIAGVPRLGIPALRLDPRRDAGRAVDLGLVAASWDVALAERVGALAGRIARAQGEALALTGGVSLGGDRFAGSGMAEDPVLAGTLAGSLARAMQGEHVVPILGTGMAPRPADGPMFDPAADARARTAVLFGLMQTRGAAVLCPATGTATPASACAGAAIAPLRVAGVFDGPLLAMAAATPGSDAAPGGADATTGLDQHVARVMRAWRAAGVIDHPAPFRTPGTLPPSLLAEQAATRETAVSEGTVLLRNTGSALPLRAGGTGDVVVVGIGATETVGAALAHALAPLMGARHVRLAASDDGHAGAVVLVVDGRADVAAWTATASDAAERGVPVIGLCLCAGTPDLAPFASLDALVVTAPTASAVPGALARLLAGRQDFSGRLPVSWPLAGEAASPYLVRDQSRRPPLFPFGAGLSATIRPVLSDLHVRAEGGRLHVVFTVANLSDEAGIAVPEVYLDRATGVAGPPKRLVGWRRVPLLPRQSQQIGLDVPRLAIEHWDAETGGWRGEVGTTWVSLGSSAVDLPLHVAVEPFAPAALSGEVR